MKIHEIAAIIYVAATFLVVLFQFCLAFGAPWGAYAMAGKFRGKFPPAMRLAAVVQAALLVLMAAVVLSAARFSVPGIPEIPGKFIWGVVGVSVLSVIANAATPNVKERKLWLPVTLVMLATCLTVALGTR